MKSRPDRPRLDRVEDRLGRVERVVEAALLVWCLFVFVVFVCVLVGVLTMILR